MSIKQETFTVRVDKHGNVIETAAQVVARINQEQPGIGAYLAPDQIKQNWIRARIDNIRISHSTYEPMQAEFTIKLSEFEARKILTNNMHSGSEIYVSGTQPIDHSIENAKLLATVKSLELKIEQIRSSVKINRSEPPKQSICSCQNLDIIKTCSHCTGAGCKSCGYTGKLCPSCGATMKQESVIRCGICGSIQGDNGTLRCKQLVDTWSCWYYVPTQIQILSEICKHKQPIYYQERGSYYYVCDCCGTTSTTAKTIKEKLCQACKE